jgi:glycosyltransferase involved in cell wall biosynthesis
VTRAFDDLKRQEDARPLQTPPKISGKPKSFGVYLGDFTATPTSNQISILLRWDTLVVDPTRSGVLDALTIHPPTASHILGRLCLQSLKPLDSTKDEEAVAGAIRSLAKQLQQNFELQPSSLSPYTGVLLAGFGADFTPAVVNGIVSHITSRGLDVWLELSPPAYLTEQQRTEIDLFAIRGLIYRNGTIRTDGDRNNYFQMTELRSTMRAVAAQRIPHGPPIILWETVDDVEMLDYAVVTRSYTWSVYQSAQSWIGSAAALHDADTAAKETVYDKPLGALTWLKSDETIKAQDVWRKNDIISQIPTENGGLFASLEEFVPNLAAKLQLVSPQCNSNASRKLSTLTSSTVPGLECSAGDPLSYSKDGDFWAGLGCFQLGLEVSPTAFAECRDTQQDLKDRKLLQRVTKKQLQDVAAKVAALINSDYHPAGRYEALHQLHSLLIGATDDENSCLNVYLGLHSGFQEGAAVQFWGVYAIESEQDALTIYLSLKTEDRAGTILHTYLASQGFSRIECFQAELDMAACTQSLAEKWQLPSRLVQDIEQLSPGETLLFLRRLAAVSVNNDCLLLERMRACCQYQLVDVPSLAQLRTMASFGYLSGSVSVESLVQSRLDWHSSQGAHHPELEAAVALFQEIDISLSKILISGQTSTLSQLSEVIQTLLDGRSIDAATDIFALAVFCAFRKLALSEVYLVVLDRNPFPNHSTDQASCFSENFAIGSRCEDFFDMTSRAFGRIVSARYRQYYMKYQPPRRTDNFVELPGTYAAMQVDIDPNDGEEKLPWYFQITFLGIFALPALIDVMMLTTVGRGLYLTVYMTDEQKKMATTALMLALLTCGGIGCWITSGGSYYLYAHTFPAMHMFVLIRYTAGMAIVVIGGVAGAIGISCVYNVVGALIFLFYFTMLTTYLLTLSALSIYQFPGSKFQSGRKTIITTVPILFLSPILSLWFNHDIIIYVSVLGAFVLTLLYRTRRLMASWTTWYSEVPLVTDAEVTEWFLKCKSIEPGTAEAKDLASGPEPRRTLEAAVLQECNRKPWTKQSQDPLVVKLATGYAATRFILGWYCRYRRSPMPLAYSGTWNLTLKTAVDSFRNMQKGLRIHNAFLHWRNTGSDVASGLLYFAVALLDKWSSLITGAPLVGLTDAGNVAFRVAVGFGLCYYLFSAVFLDAVSQPLWSLVNETNGQPVTSLDNLQSAVAMDALARRRVYWKNFSKFFLLHTWGAAITAALIWTFEPDENAIYVYFSYVGGYCGLLWYQYNKIYCADKSAASLALGLTVGLPIGTALHICFPGFAFSGVIGLGAGTYTAALHSFWLSKVGHPIRSNRSAKDKPLQIGNAPSTRLAITTMDPHPDISQATIAKLLRFVRGLPEDQKLRLNPASTPGDAVVEILRAQAAAKRPYLLDNAFPDASQLLQSAVAFWERGKTVVDMVSSKSLSHFGLTSRTVSEINDGILHIVVVVDLSSTSGQWISAIHRNNQIVAEAIMQATAELHLGLSHEHSLAAESLVSAGTHTHLIEIPEGLKHQFETSINERNLMLRDGDKRMLRHLLLNVDSESDWDKLSTSVRVFLLARSLGVSSRLSSDAISWIESRMTTEEIISHEQFTARCDFAVVSTVSALQFCKQIEHSDYHSDTELLRQLTNIDEHFPAIGAAAADMHRINFFSRTINTFWTCVKFIIIAFTAEPEYQRELDYMLRNQHGIIRWPITFFLNSVWRLCRSLQDAIIPVVLFHRRQDVSTLRRNMKNSSVTLQKKKLIITGLDGVSTCFWAETSDGKIELSHYSGQHEQAPEETKSLMAVNVYSKDLILEERTEYQAYGVSNKFTYEYPQSSKRRSAKLPIQRRCTAGVLYGQIAQYDERGYIMSGSTVIEKNAVNFTYWYRTSAKFEDELLRGEFVFAHITIRVFWSMPSRNHADDLDTWLPFSKVTEAVFIQGSDIYHATWAYDHKYHPEVTTTLNGLPVATPPMIAEDWFHVLSKPERSSFSCDNPLLHFRSLNTNIFLRTLGLNTKHFPTPTSQARSALWKMWKKGNGLDAITARWLDEDALRTDSSLKPYWWTRDFGMLNSAKAYLNEQCDTVMARVDISTDISSWTHLAFKMSDLYAFGTGGDSRLNTRTVDTQLRDSSEEMHVLAMDNSTWPNEPGGVSACRNDMITNLKSIRWHMLAESGNDYWAPKFQIEKNVQSMTVMPLWGLDFLNPCHGILENHLDSQISNRSFTTTELDIIENFFPILESLVRCSRVVQMTREGIEEATSALVDLNTYFETSRNWNNVWMSDIVKQRWRELWLSEDMQGTLPISGWWDFERPTIMQLDLALNMWHRYLLIFSLPLPEKVPEIYQSSHHFTGASYGILCKIKRGATLHVWDHCISYREFTTFMSSGVSFDSPFVNSSLISLTRLSCVLLEHHADVVLPCAAYFNPGWEVELGSAEGVLEHRKTFRRKIDPVVNGICNMDKFKPVEKIRTKTPTVVMLGHIQYVKDVKSAVMAADLIVHKWGFKDYRVDIYGDMSRAPAHTTEVQELIASKDLQDVCLLKGLGNPAVVLQDAWIFVNSSVTEGLPLAMGEAALAGVPVVCTDVGASFCVVTDGETGARFSEVVSPNDPDALARAQINILAMLGQWSAYADDAEGHQAPILGYPNPSPEQVEAITARMYEKTEQRRKLGMFGRQNVINNFGEERYLREHEQMLWVGQNRNPHFRRRRAVLSTSSSSIRSSLKKPLRPPRIKADSWKPLSKEKQMFRDSVRIQITEIESGTETPSSRRSVFQEMV